MPFVCGVGAVVSVKSDRKVEAAPIGLTGFYTVVAPDI